MNDAPAPLLPPSSPGTLWDNPELRRAVLLFLAAGLVVLAAALFLWHRTVETAHRQALERDLSVIGQLASRHPEWRDDIARSYARTATPAERAAGLEAAGRFGYDTSLPLSRDMTHLFRSGAVGLTALLLLLTAVLLAGTARILGGLYRTAEHYAVLAERIVEGDFRTEVSRPAEGAFSKLAHQFQVMANRLEHTLDRLREEKDGMKQLLSDISHQLKTPLSALQMFTELAQDEDLAPAKRKEFLSKGEDQIGKMEWLIRQLLTVARMEAGATKLQLLDQPLRHTVEEAVATLSPYAGQRGVELRLLPDPDRTIRLPHDSAWLAEALGNLIKNGVEHTTPGGRVELRLEETGVLARILIRDTGSGIPPEELPLLFRRFYRGPASPTGGAGIGLSLAKAVVEQHGGFISVRSEPGKGSLFTVTLPREMTKS